MGQVMCGGFQKQDLSEAANAEKFLHEKLGEEAKGWKLVDYQKQLVNGFNHLLTYEDKDGKRVTYKVYESFNNSF